MQAACTCQSNVVGFQPVANTNQTERSNSRTSAFDTRSSLTGNDETDQLVLGLIIALVQLIMQQMGGNNGNGQQNSSNGNAQNQTAPELQFSATDKGHLLNAIGPSSPNTQVGRIQDSDASQNLNAGDDVELLTGTNSANHDVTDAEARRFIELRNPPNTVKLPLSDQQLTILQNLYGLEEIQISDNNGDSQISVGDFISGFQEQGDKRLQLDIPVDLALVALLNV